MKPSWSELAVPILALPRAAKRFVVLCVDLALCVLTVWFAFALRLGELVALSGPAWPAIGVSVGLAVPVFLACGLYRAIFRSTGWPALLAVARAVAIYGLLYAALFTAIGVPGVPRTVGIVQPILLLLLVGASRAFARLWLGDQYQSILRHASRPRVLVYGAGSTGRRLVRALAQSHEMQAVGFLDDDDRLHGHVLDGQAIHNPADLPGLVASLSVVEVLLALPGLDRKRRNEVLERLRQARVAVRTLPPAAEGLQGELGITDLRELDIDDLLGREPAAPNHILLAMNVRNKVVVVTGAAGAIGSELCRQALQSGPAKLLLIDQSEFALSLLHRELEGRAAGRGTVLVPLLASVQDEGRMREIMSTWQPDTVYHAAAYTHIPLVEHNPAEGIKNNVLGTLRAAQAAMEHGVADFVLVSTDRAVRPAHILGASKRLAELVVQALAGTGPVTRFSVVRFGRVLGPSGSVVPRLRQQIRNGGPVTVPHPEATRLFMTIPEAAQLVIQAGAMARGGEVFALDMGPSERLVDLARRMVELSGLAVRDDRHPEGNIEILVTGLQPGERLHDEAFLGEEPGATLHPRILKAREDSTPWADLEAGLRSLEMVLNVNDVGVIHLMMQKLVPGYAPASDIVDWVYLEQEALADRLAMV